MRIEKFQIKAQVSRDDSGHVTLTQLDKVPMLDQVEHLEDNVNILKLSKQVSDFNQGELTQAKASLFPTDPATGREVTYFEKILV